MSKKKLQLQTPEKPSCKQGLHFQGFLKPSSDLLLKSARNLWKCLPRTGFIQGLNCTWSDWTVLDPAHASWIWDECNRGREGLVLAFPAATHSFKLSKHKGFQGSTPTQPSHMHYLLKHHRRVVDTENPSTEYKSGLYTFTFIKEYHYLLKGFHEVDVIITVLLNLLE